MKAILSIQFRRRLMLGLSFFISLSINATASQDSARITINESNISIEAVLRKIEAQAGVAFYYAIKDLDGHDILPNVSLKKASIDEALSVILKGRRLSWKNTDGGIVLFPQRIQTPQKNMIESPIYDTISKPLIKGTVISDEGLPMVGATVLIKGTNIGTVTNSNGQFVLKDGDAGAIVIVSYTGYASQELKVRPREVFSVRLNREIGSLDETIVIGYGNTSRRFNTGSVSKVSSEEISRQPVSNPISTLQGRVSGAFITTQNGLPGGNVKVVIRGKGSIAAGTEPLYIVDGVPFTSTPLNTFNPEFTTINGPVSPLNSIPPSEIESIEVLKDADATAIYGSRGANGIVLITTKKGKPGRTTLNFNSYIGFSKIARKPKFLDLNQFLELRREGFRNDTLMPTRALAPDLVLWDTTHQTDWFDYILGGTAPINQYELSLTGGNKQTNFSIGLNYRREGTILPGEQKYKRLGSHLNLNHTSINSNFQIGLTVSFSADKNTLIRNIDAVGIASLAPNYPIYNMDGSLNWEIPLNPVAWLKQKSNSETDNLIANLSLRYTVVPGLNLKLSGGYSRLNMDLMSTLPKSSQWPVLSPVSSASFGNGRNTNYLLEPQAEYSTQIKRNNFKVLIGGTLQHNVSRNNAVKGTNYSNETLLENIGYAGNVEYATNIRSEYKYLSGFGRINYIYNAKYLISANFRRDGSTRFGKDNRYGNFWALGAGWVFSNEEFVRDFRSLLSFGKLRASYGVTGNDQIGNYQYLATYSSGMQYLGAATLQPSLLANAEYGWEANKKFETALELGFCKERIFLTIASYFNRSTNQLVAYPVPFSSGFGSYQANLPAVIVNRGWEIDVSSTNINSNGFLWTTSFNVTFQKNVLRSFPNIKYSSYANTYVVGEDLSVVKRLRFMGINSQTGVAAFEDVNKDGKLSFPDDYIPVGKISPQYFGGLENNLAYKGVQFSLFFQFVKQDALDNLLLTGTPPNSSSNSYANVLSRWRSPGDITDIQRATVKSGTTAYNAIQSLRNSSMQLIDASFVRLKNISMSYSFPSSLTNKIKIQKLRIYAEGQNVATFSIAKDVDPETVNGLNLTVPVLRTWAAGFQITL
ncbi:SusC/RagA family TonB-linked outer membrane protein [Chitinophaga lutea]|uniref:SusC/RagA family TonB-linked outer membrane protein n=1 Tax=Chitinophaga lutea TaxID=2488634 RepID=A0A3N4Q3J6_9BACT|nr:SusC/RagA family TonB-linked outer membrane protein [Chitinophaga lutea]RPE12041.1 SusC/RagA family TonB-linked outer membrane protein [Chitinophaga lutea]